MRIPIILSACVLLALPVTAQINITNGANIDMTGSTGSVIIFPDATTMGTAPTGGSAPADHGGAATTVSGTYAFVGGGIANTASARGTTVSGGESNTASANRATIGGGYANMASGNYATVGGGQNNDAQVKYSTIAGGGPSFPGSPTTTNNKVTDEYGTIGGGGNNQAGDDAGTTTDKTYATVGGGYGNTASGTYAAVGGGYKNAASGISATTGGGRSNVVSGHFATVGGGKANLASGLNAMIGGGQANGASGTSSTVGGGVFNDASGDYAAVGGGHSNTAAGDFSFASGRRAKIAVAHGGSFLFADQTNADFNSSATNEFAVRATGGVRFVTNIGGTTGAVLSGNDSSWSAPSSKSLKENYEEVDALELLDKLTAMPIQKWNYIDNDDNTKHIGPYSEDFYEAFGLNGEFTGRITTQDLDGVALAAIQGLNRKLEAELERRNAELAEIRAQYVALGNRVELLEGRLIE